MPDIAIDRLDNQRLTHPTLTSPGEVVAYMGALQAQDYAGAKWSVGLRLPGSTNAAIEQALTNKTIVRILGIKRYAAFCCNIGYPLAGCACPPEYSDHPELGRDLAAVPVAGL